MIEKFGLYRARHFVLGLLLMNAACASGREFWTYVVEAPVDKPSRRETGEAVGVPASPHVVKVVYSDGATSTEVQVPVLTSGQEIIVDQKGRPAQSAVNLVPLAPGAADQKLEESYIKSGKPVSQKATPVSIVKTQAMLKKLMKEGNYSLALEYVDQLLQRYPQHVESLRAKGSILMKMGEREAALETYRQAQDIEPDPLVQKQIQTLEKTLGR